MFSDVVFKQFDKEIVESQSFVNKHMTLSIGKIVYDIITLVEKDFKALDKEEFETELMEAKLILAKTLEIKD